MHVNDNLLSTYDKPEENATEAQLGSGGLRWVPYSYRDMPEVEFGDVEVEFEV